MAIVGHAADLQDLQPGPCVVQRPSLAHDLQDKAWYASNARSAASLTGNAVLEAASWQAGNPDEALSGLNSSKISLMIHTSNQFFDLVEFLIVTSDPDSMFESARASSACE